MPEYRPTIGLEVHAELKTATKMFCGCPNNPDEDRPNTNVCPVCLGHPGILPTINKKAIELLIKVGLALGAKINPAFKFDRKNYFYPDLPKGYQLSQYDLPIVGAGNLEGVRINRVHLEEDAGKLVHAPDGKSSLVDFNRGGVPLMELVTEPDIHSAREAVVFAKELQLLLRYLNVSDADLDRGLMRADANVSVSANDQLGTKVEIKNLNSFSAIEAAINYEIKRQTEALEAGETLHQETRGWDEVKQATKTQRSKEHAHDYRYFPEPDLPPLAADAFNLEVIRASLSELPAQRRARFQKEYNLDSTQARILVEDKSAAEFFEQAVSELEEEEGKIISLDKVRLVFNYLTSDMWGLMKELAIDFKSVNITPENFADLIEMIVKKMISSRTAKDLLRKMQETSLDPRMIVQQEGLQQVSGEGELQEIAQQVIAANPAAVADYKKGKTTVLQFFVGKAMGVLKGKGNPEVLRQVFEKILSGV
ncbi:MAG TPA: Asp-tRNA(Asn)/Glu-tRNA(Gln) amidotransferase subunit GatB [Candidatus Paceibacterota bacterium]